MKHKILENAVIYDGKVYEYIYDGNINVCEGCDLRDSCRESNGELCEQFETYKGHRFKHVGTIEDVISGNNAYKEARHHIAVLIKANQWRTDNEGIRHAPNPSEFTVAIDFAIKKLKEIYV